MSAAISTNKPELFSEIIRRRAVGQLRLQQQAIQYLPYYIISPLLEPIDGLLDTKTPSIYQELLSLDPLPDIEHGHFCGYPGGNFDTVYSYVLGNLSAAQLAYDAGFTDLNQTDPDGITPLMALCCRGGSPCGNSEKPLVYFARIVHWLVEKGANLYQYSAAGYPAIWYLAEQFGYGLHFRSVEGMGSFGLPHCDHEEWGSQQIPDTQDARLLSTLSTDSFTDDCICACSGELAGGCTALLLLLHALRPTCSNALYWDKATELAPQEFTAENLAIASQVIIRYITFEGLELTHTCHHWNNGSYVDLRDSCRHDVAGDESQIRDEEQLLIQKLNDLVPEFIAEYNRLDVTLHKYIEDYWTPRMKGMFATPEGGFDVDEVRRVQEVGVVLEGHT
ncbi:hypothetical protein BDW74DRAFT_172660 [Aspergillus multicolor]|uniref:uncharacterized protein n=1 Tax=Aspergillus multicolor TaxID=41759 RepID=UPI003CCE0608